MKQDSRPKAAVFYNGYGHCWGCVRTWTEQAGPFDTLHLAFKDADAAGFEVVDVLRTRGLFKAKSPPIEEPQT